MTGLHRKIEYLEEDIKKALELAWDLECGISWYDVDETKEKLHKMMARYRVKPFEDGKEE